MDRVCSNPQCRHSFPANTGSFCSLCGSATALYRPPSLPPVPVSAAMPNSPVVRQSSGFLDSPTHVPHQGFATIPPGLNEYRGIRSPPPGLAPITQAARARERPAPSANPRARTSNNTRKRDRSEDTYNETRRARVRITSETPSEGNYPASIASLPPPPIFRPAAKYSDQSDREEGEIDEAIHDVIKKEVEIAQTVPPGAGSTISEDWCLICCCTGHWHEQCRDAQSLPVLPKKKSSWNAYAEVNDIRDIPHTYVQAMSSFHELYSHILKMAKFQHLRDRDLLLTYGSLKARVDKNTTTAWRGLVCEANGASNRFITNLRIEMEKFEAAIYHDVKGRMDSHPRGMKKTTRNQHDILIWTRPDAVQWIAGLQDTPWLNGQFKEESFRETANNFRRFLHKYTERQARCTETAQQMISTMPAGTATEILKDLGRPVKLMFVIPEIEHDAHISKDLVAFPNLMED
ncbi:hypothetical protein H2200_013489 [Cladophialophora chaetospira]|uniref:Uncharacterized protein n=1 Tax=Cladophialophora chaetospira TaxID=386627 RepID=A0AA38TZ85_9EURO|nr:hypothetical protein H2200_013489 [Cladophialophora chaetospira]